MKTVIFLVLVFFSGYPTLHQAAQKTSTQVVNIFDDGTLETLSFSGQRQKIRLAGIQTITFPHQIKPATVKRLKSLVLGKTVQLEILNNQLVLMSLGGMDISSRLLSEGLALLEQTSLQILPIHVRQRLISAEEQARQYRRGIWQQPHPGTQQRFHYPFWPAERLPSPITNAPVYKPDTQ